MELVTKSHLADFTRKLLENDKEIKDVLHENIVLISNEVTKLECNRDYILLEDFGYSEEKTVEENRQMFIDAIECAKENSKPILLLNKTYDFGDERVSLSDISIKGISKNATLKCSVCLGDNITLDTLTVYTSSSWIVPHTKHSGNFIAKNVIFTADGNIRGFYINDAIAENYKFFDCDFSNGASISLVCKCSNDMYIEDFYVARCKFTYPSHFSCVGRRKNEGVKMDRGWKNLRLESCEIIGTDSPKDDYDINFTVDAPDLSPTLEPEYYGIKPICSGLYVDNCKIYNGYFVFENAGATDVTVSNNTIISNDPTHLAISQSRLKGFKNLNIEYRNNTIYGNCRFVGSTRLINNTFNGGRITTIDGKFNIDGGKEIRSIYQENASVLLSDSSFSSVNDGDNNNIFGFGGSDKNSAIISNTIINRSKLNDLFGNVTSNSKVSIFNSSINGFIINESLFDCNFSLNKKTTFKIPVNKRLKISFKKNATKGLDYFFSNFNWVSRQDNSIINSKFSLFSGTYSAGNIAFDGIDSSNVEVVDDEDSVSIALTFEKDGFTRNDVAFVNFEVMFSSEIYMNSGISFSIID